MRRVSRTLIAALAVFLLVAGLAACGGGDDSTATKAGSQEQAGGSASAGDASGGGAKGESGSGGDQGKQGGSGDESADGGSGSFTPKHHNDSGGGSEQFRVKGGDNSVQEYGEEADAPELDAAAVALHNFLDARAAGDWTAACSYIAKSATEAFEKLAELAKQIGDTGCAGILEKLTNPAARQSMQEEADKANVGSLRIEGERAFVIYTGIDGTVLAMPMANEGGTWKVASLAGTPLS